VLRSLGATQDKEDTDLHEFTPLDSKHLTGLTLIILATKTLRHKENNQSLIPVLSSSTSLTINEIEGITNRF